VSRFLDEIASPGDRWQLPSPSRSADSLALALGPGWDALLAPGEEVLVDAPDAGILHARYLSEACALESPGFAGLALARPERTWYLELVSSQPLTFRLVAGDDPQPDVPTGVVTEKGVPVTFAAQDWEVLKEAFVPYQRFALSRRAAELAATRGFDQLISLPLLRDVELYEHQLRTVKTVLRRFRGRALLCDEVGLGKTVEAGMVMLELLARKLVRRVLVLVPPALVEQWQGELSHKFGLDFVAHDEPRFRALEREAWLKYDRIVASYHTAKREPHRSAIASQQWDMVIVDEAHHLRNRNTMLWKFASALNKRYVLLLTATPLQNDLEELYNLVTLLQPGLLSTARQFRRTFLRRGDKLAPRNLDQLQGLLAEAMVRNRRATVGMRFTRRFAQTLPVLPLPGERKLYDEVSSFVRASLRSSTQEQGQGDARALRPRVGLSRMALIALQKEMGSCSLAAAPTLERLAEGSETPKVALRLRDLAAQARRQVDSAKAARLVQLLRDFPDKMVIFTQFQATQDYLAGVLTEVGEPPALFNGRLPRLAKEAAVAAFRGGTRLLLATDSGSEGRNLQFCHAICNFDLPWNPMRIEQRVGRLSRIGQSEDVYVFNLVSAGTLEADLLYLLEAKVNLFEMVMGEMDMVLGNLDEEREFEDLVLDLWAASEDETDFHGRLERLGDELAAAKEAYLRQRELDERLFGDSLVPEG